MRLATLCAAALFITPAIAQEEVIDKVDQTIAGLAGDGRLIGGAGLAITSAPYSRVDDEVNIIPIPLISYQSERFEFIGKTLEAQVVELEGVAFSAVADWRFQGYDADDSIDLQGMDDRKGTLEIGARAKTTALGVQVAGTALVDVLSRHGGYELDARASIELSSWEPLSVRPTAGIRYQSSSLADYYFGVDPEEALVNFTCIDQPCPNERPAYETGDAIVPFIGVTARQALSRKLVVAGSIQYDFLPDTIQDSPIVEDSNQIFSFIGIAYAFGAPLGSEGSYETRVAR